MLDTFKHDLINTVAFSNNNDLNHIKAATKSYQHTPEMFKPDLIAEKGEGRIILLHGSPGLGKTYTAECIAEWSSELTCSSPNIYHTDYAQAVLYCV
jgi:SpoVK/Ycf46/Vps4 family AAA+-type ATPase